MDPDSLPTVEINPSSLPSKDEATQYALMVTGGIPPMEAIRYFFPPEADEGVIKTAAKVWVRSEEVKRALLRLQHGKTWQGMSLPERISFTIEKHYSEMAYFLYSHNYSTLIGADKLKADTCRSALEAKLAGTAGKMSPLEQFWEDVRSGKLVLGGTSKGSSTPVVLQ